jgi:hypothetical protein
MFCLRERAGVIGSGQLWYISIIGSGWFTGIVEYGVSAIPGTFFGIDNRDSQRIVEYGVYHGNLRFAEGSLQVQYSGDNPGIPLMADTDGLLPSLHLSPLDVALPACSSLVPDPSGSR